MRLLKGISHMCLTILRWSLVLSTVLLGRFYGIQMVDSANKSSADFYKVLNDDVLIDNIETNILKNIADNEARPEGSPEIKFSVLIAPADMVSYNKDPSKMRSLSEKEG
jgi:hypothetical protein